VWSGGRTAAALAAPTDVLTLLVSTIAWLTVRILIRETRSPVGQCEIHVNPRRWSVFSRQVGDSEMDRRRQGQGEHPLIP
jgi:hypothetical protein